VAMVTRIGSDPQQIDYRLSGRHGCTPGGAGERQFSYHTDGRERPLRWIGEGLREVDIEPGTMLTDEDFDTARALIHGLDPRTGQRLVTHKVAVYDDAKVPLVPLLSAIRAVCRASARTPAAVLGSSRLHTMFQRAERAVAAAGDAAALRADHAGQLADAAGIPVDQVWGVEVFGRAVSRLTEQRTTTTADGRKVHQVVPRRRVVGNLGYDVTLTLPKSYSLLLAFASEDTAAAIERLYSEQMGRAFRWVETQTAYGMRGHHGDGQRAEVVAGSGFLGWTMVHRAARPVDDAAVGDPHWHVHITLANMTRGKDGKWSTVAAGGRDLMRHMPATDKLLQALVRGRLHRDLGVRFARNPRTGLWEVAGIPDATLRHFSRRGASIEALLADLGFTSTDATSAARRLAGDLTRRGKTDATGADDQTLREAWQDDARRAGIDPDALIRRALPDPSSDSDVGEVRDEVLVPGMIELVAALTDPDSGLTAHARRFSHLDALAMVADQLPHGAADIDTVERLTDRVLAHHGFVRLGEFGTGDTPAGEHAQLGAAHMANAQRYTTADVIAAERLILDRAHNALHDALDQPAAGPVLPGQAQRGIAAAEAAQGYPLSAQQRAAVLRLVTSRQSVQTVVGGPGSGKTTMLRAAQLAWQAGGLVVAGAATQGTTAQNLTAESGIGALTVAQWVWRIHHGRGLAGVDVLVLDEAGMTDDRHRAVLYAEAARTGTQLVEVGDPKQLRGVGCGSLFARLHAILAGPELVENRRQLDEDERVILAAWRAGRYAAALTGWAERGRLVATETPQEATTVMVTAWMAARQGAPDPHTELRGLTMLAATNEQVDRINQAAQAVRLAQGELGAGHTYATGHGEQLRLHVGDHVMLRITSRRQRLHAGPDVFNGYRGVVDQLDDDGTATISFERDEGDGPIRDTARLDAAYIAHGGVNLGYTTTIHRAQGLTIKGTWDRPDGSRNAGTVLVYAPGADNPGQYVASSRHRGELLIVGSRQELETAQDTYLHGTPTTVPERTARVVAALAKRARDTATNDNDRPALDDLDTQRAGGLAEQVAAATARRTTAPPTDPTATEDTERTPTRHEQRPPVHRA
jgi:conjugative relaxase-like TrwC/TraI family protein